MRNGFLAKPCLFVSLVWQVGLFNCAEAGGALEPVVFTVRFPTPAAHAASVEAAIPTGGQASVELVLPVWTPGFYRVEDYSSRVQGLSARAPDGAPLEVTQPKPNRWRIETGGAPKISVSYQLSCGQKSVTTSWVGDDLAVLNGPATFPALLEKVARPYEVQLELAAGWERSMTALDAAPDGLPNHFRADDYDTLADSPIVAGKLFVREFEVEGSRHYVVDAGDVGKWDGARAAQDLERIVRQNHRFWCLLPFKRYVFLNVFRQGGGGLEHKSSTLLTSSPGGDASTKGYASWLTFVCHEYIHAFNVKRLRPAELDTFDYEKPPRTASLWVSEGLTCYYDEILTARAGLRSSEDVLAGLSSKIQRLQKSPGRLVQSLERASLEVWGTPTSGLPRDDSVDTVSYYVKGPIVGFLLDAKIQQATGGRKSLDDVMRLAYQRYSGEHGFTPEQFQMTTEEVAGVDLKGWFHRAVSSTEELDYSEALEWYGLQLGPKDDAARMWQLETRPDSTVTQRACWRKLVDPTLTGAK